MTAVCIFIELKIGSNGFKLLLEDYFFLDWHQSLPKFEQTNLSIKKGDKQEMLM